MVRFWQAFVQIVTEVFPISSSGHVKLLEQLFHLPVLPATIDYLMHIPMLLILVIFWAPVLWPMITTGRIGWRQFWTWVWYGFIAMVGSVLGAGAVWAAGEALKLYHVTSCCACGMSDVCGMICGFVGTAAVLYSLRFVDRVRTTEPCGWSMEKKVFWIGMVQGLALLPGLSRFATTYTAGRWLGFSSRTSFGFSWWISLPILGFGALLGLTTTVFGTGADAVAARAFCAMPSTWIMTLLCTAFAYICYRWVLKAAERGLLWYGAIYMIVPIIGALLVGLHYA